MPTIAQQHQAFETTMPNSIRSTTTLFDLMTNLHDSMDDTEAALIPATIMDLTHTHHIRFLNIPQEHRVICG